MERQVLGVGQKFDVKKSVFGKHVVLRYAGQPTPESFSVAISWSRNYNSAAFNLFFPVDCRGFDVLDHGHVTVQDVDARKISFVWEPAR